MQADTRILQNGLEVQEIETKHWQVYGFMNLWIPPVRKLTQYLHSSVEMPNES